MLRFQYKNANFIKRIEFLDILKKHYILHIFSEYKIYNNALQKEKMENK